MGETCKTCRFFYSKTKTIGCLAPRQQTFLFCCRYPKPETTTPNYYCGEHQPTDKEKP